MNRNDTNLLRDVIIAYVDGRNIQSRRKGSEKWNDDEYPQFDSSAYEYRIKPEYRPFGNRNECIEGILNNGSKGIVIDRDGNKDDISWMIEDKAMIPYPEIFRMAMKCYRFPDGTPFGAEVFK